MDFCAVECRTRVLICILHVPLTAESGKKTSFLDYLGYHPQGNAQSV